MKLKDFRRDLKAEVDGEWNAASELGFDDKTGKPIELLTRSIHYAPFKMDLRQTQMRLARKYGDEVPPDVEDMENGRLYATHLLLGWRGIEEPFTPALALEELTRVDARDFRDATVACARVVGKRRAKQVEAIAGNSGGGSASS
jgi:hypothetical protein